MQWRVIKMGSDLFDILHTYGLGIVVASATQQPVTVQEVEGFDQPGVLHWFRVAQ